MGQEYTGSASPRSSMAGSAAVTSLCKMRYQVILMFIIGVWVGYGLLRLGDMFPLMIDESPTLKDARENELRINWINSIALKFWDSKENTSMCFKNASIGINDPVWLSLRWYDMPPLRIFYNRVPKTGSSVTLAVIKALSKRNKLVKVSSPVNVLFNMSVPYQEVFVQSLYRYKTPLIYDRHLYFVDFKSFGQHQPMYINTVREPIAHFLSFYYYMRKLSAWRNRYTQKESKISLDQCLNNSLIHCETHRQFRFFCGQEKICNLPDPPRGALQLAKKNIERHYSVVGINEDLLGFFQILETFVPKYFKGAESAYKKHQNDYRHFTTKKQQSPLQPSTIVLLKKILKFDYELYSFAKQRLYKQKCIRDHIIRNTQVPKTYAQPSKRRSGTKSNKRSTSSIIMKTTERKPS